MEKGKAPQVPQPIGLNPNPVRMYNPNEGIPSEGGTQGTSTSNTVINAPDESSIAESATRTIQPTHTPYEDEAMYLMEEVRKIDETLQDLKLFKATNSDKQLVERDLRHQKMDYNKELSELLVIKHQKL